MIPETRSSRRVFAGALLFSSVSVVILAWKGVAPPYAPAAPQFRQKGPADAQVQLAEFSDFQCPHCATAVEPLRMLFTIYPGKIHLTYKYRPWPSHEHAKEAAIAAECAGRAGKFWEYHDALYSHQSEWGSLKSAREVFLGYARELGLKQGPFASCLDSTDASAAVDSDIKEAGRHWINSTPTFFINGTRLVGVQQLRTLGRNRIEDILKK